MKRAGHSGRPIPPIEGRPTAVVVAARRTNGSPSLLALRGRAAFALASDETVLKACGTGDLAAVDVLFDRLHSEVYGFLRRFPGADDLPFDDIVQLTFLAAPRAALRFRGRSSVTTWILGIAANNARHYLRGERRLQEKHALYAEGRRCAPECPDEWVERRELFRQIECVLASLPTDQQAAFRGCELEEVSGVDIARVAGVPPGTVWRRLHVARKAVRAAVHR
jgi:RNA polymerase sigma-70 factor, ECF subfamily